MLFVLKGSLVSNSFDSRGLRGYHELAVHDDGLKKRAPQARIFQLVRGFA